MALFYVFIHIILNDMATANSPLFTDDAIIFCPLLSNSIHLRTSSLPFSSYKCHLMVLICLYEEQNPDSCNFPEVTEIKDH